MVQDDERGKERAFVNKKRVSVLVLAGLCSCQLQYKKPLVFSVSTLFSLSLGLPSSLGCSSSDN